MTVTGDAESITAACIGNSFARVQIYTTTVIMGNWPLSHYLINLYFTRNIILRDDNYALFVIGYCVAMKQFATLTRFNLLMKINILFIIYN